MIRNRYRRIVWFFAKIFTGIILWDLFLPHLGLRGWSGRTRPERYRRIAVDYRRLAVQMGGVLIKVGQFLSARVDVLPPEITQELSGLQDEVSPEDFATIQQVAEAAYGCPLNVKFSEFDLQPLAAASLGQVHRARLHPEVEQNSNPSTDGSAMKDVVVKVQRPEIDKIIQTDMAALYTVGNWLNRYRPIRQRADVPALLNEFSEILYQEIDYINEGRNVEIFQENFREYAGVKVPRVIWSHTTRTTLTLEDVSGIKITDYAAITAAGISRAEVASRLLNTYLKQIFEDGFFHADPHPGNLFVHTSNGGKDWTLTFVDFGMTVQIPDRVLQGLREMLIGVGTQDTHKVVESYRLLDVLLPGANIELIEKATGEVFQRYWGKTMTELTQIDVDEIREFTREFRDLLYDLPFQVPSNLLYLGRTVGILSGMCTGLDPNFNLWEHLAPFARKLIAQEFRQNGGQWLDEIRNFVRLLIVIPSRLEQVLTKIERGELNVRTPELSKQLTKIEHSQRQLPWAFLCGTFFLAGAIFFTAGSQLLTIVSLSMAGIVLAGLIISSINFHP